MIRKGPMIIKLLLDCVIFVQYFIAFNYQQVNHFLAFFYSLFVVNYSFLNKA